MLGIHHLWHVSNTLLLQLTSLEHITPTNMSGTHHHSNWYVRNIPLLQETCQECTTTPINTPFWTTHHDSLNVFDTSSRISAPAHNKPARRQASYNDSIAILWGCVGQASYLDTSTPVQGSGTHTPPHTTGAGLLLWQCSCPVRLNWMGLLPWH